MSGFLVSTNALEERALTIDSEQELLSQLEVVDERLGGDFWRRYDQLVSMREKEKLVPGSPEHAELIRMTNLLECCHADRLLLLVEFAKVLGTSLADLMGKIPSPFTRWGHGTEMHDSPLLDKPTRRCDG